MRLIDWLTVCICSGLLACGSDAEYGESTPPTEVPSEGSVKEKPDAKRSVDAGTRASTPTKDAGRPQASASMSTGDDGPVDNTCDAINVSAISIVPEILIVLDRSASMIGLGDPRNAGKNRWTPSVNAVQKLTTQLSGTVAFGLMTFPGRNGSSSGRSASGGSCTPGAVDVPIGQGTAQQIASVLARSGPDLGATPTAKSLEVAYDAIVARGTTTAICADCMSVPKYVLLVTDGQPTCGSAGLIETSSDQIAATNVAIDRLKTAGVPTYVIGYDTLSDPAAAAAMDGFAQHGGTQKHFPVENEQTLLTELTRIAGGLVPCDYALSTEIHDPAYVRVTIDEKQYSLSGGDWRIEGKKIILTGACGKLRDGKAHKLSIVRECERVDII